MRVPGRGVRPESPLAGGGYCYRGGWSEGERLGIRLCFVLNASKRCDGSSSGWETETHHQIRAHVEGRASGRAQQPQVQPGGVVVLLGLPLREHHAP